jgi:hypothetical protein
MQGQDDNKRHGLYPHPEGWSFTPLSGNTQTPDSMSSVFFFASRNFNLQNFLYLRVTPIHHENFSSSRGGTCLLLRRKKMKELMRVTYSLPENGIFILRKDEDRGTLKLSRPVPKWDLAEDAWRVFEKEYEIDDPAIIEIVETLIQAGKKNLAWHVVGLRLDIEYLMGRARK